jgi:murein DD-endopeptidase MepM/ murein hydrolase activator NlpD
VAAVLSAVLAAAEAAAASSGHPGLPPLELPVRCQMGQTCFVQQYFDHDPGPGAKDYRCGPMVYDGHDGVDIRVPTLADMHRGVDVLAAAPGVVEGVRDGMDDIDVRIAGAAAVKGRECGNGVLIAHADGWKTLYCHMAKGSVAVAKGQSVRLGERLGRIGESGDAAFPHLHFSVLHGGAKVDPFAWDAPAGRCGTGASLWSPAAAAALAYRSPQVIAAGFAPGAVDLDGAVSGEAEAARPGPLSPALTAWALAIGLKAGDVVSLTLTGPDQEVMARAELAPLAHDRAEQLAFAGLKRKAEPWRAGVYRGQLEIRRDGALVLVKRMEFSISEQAGPAH